MSRTGREHALPFSCRNTVSRMPEVPALKNSTNSGSQSMKPGQHSFELYCISLSHLFDDSRSVETQLESEVCLTLHQHPWKRQQSPDSRARVSHFSCLKKQHF